MKRKNEFRPIYNAEPSTFYTSETDILILDDKHNPFYWHPNKEQHINFNLPKGEYYANVPLRRRKRFKPYGNASYPKFRRGILSRINIFAYPNKNKASIDIENREIFVDPKYYYHKYKPVQTFTLLHELFHHFFRAKTKRERENYFIRQWYEKQCDKNARHFMLANGWNPSQVDYAIQGLLKGKHRKDCIKRITTDKRNNFRR